jgi:hypothetical protein
MVFSNIPQLQLMDIVQTYGKNLPAKLLQS